MAKLSASEISVRAMDFTCLRCCGLRRFRACFVFVGHFDGTIVLRFGVSRNVCFFVFSILLVRVCRAIFLLVGLVLVVPIVLGLFFVRCLVRILLFCILVRRLLLCLF